MSLAVALRAPVLGSDGIIPLLTDRMPTLSGPGRSPGVLENKRIRPPFLADRRGRPVSWIDDRVIRQVEQLGEDAGHELLVTATEVGSTDRALKQDIAAEREGGS